MSLVYRSPGVQTILVTLQRLRMMGVAVLMLVSFFGALLFAWRGVDIEQTQREKLDTALALTRDAMEIKFLAADFNGWQTAYAFDIVRGTPGATKDDAPVRNKFLASAASFRERLRAMKTDPSIPDEHPEVERMEVAFQEFMDLDQAIVAAYRGGDARAVRQANDWILGREIQLFQHLAQAITRLADSIVARANRASREASMASARARWLFVGAAVATALLVASLVLVLIRLLVREADLSARIDAITYRQRGAADPKQGG